MAEEQDDRRGLRMRFRQVEKATDAYTAVSAVQLEEDTARWIELAEAGSKLAFAVGKGDVGALTQPARELARAPLDVEAAQARLLQSIDENAELLRDGPFKTGRLYLIEANRLIDSPERSVKFVERAQEQFYQAHSLATEPIDQADGRDAHRPFRRFSLGQPEDSRHWLAQAYSKAVLKAHELAEKTGNTKVIKGTGITQAATRVPSPSAPALRTSRTKKIKRTRSNTHAQDGLRVVLPLIGCIAAVLHTAGGADPGWLTGPAAHLDKPTMSTSSPKSPDETRPSTSDVAWA